jgi:hypothetical protein
LKLLPQRNSASKPRNPLPTDFSMDVALGLYDLEHMEVFVEHQHDTVALLGWGPTNVVLTFRGTTTLKNVFTDLQVRPSCPPPPIQKRGRIRLQYCAAC